MDQADLAKAQKINWLQRALRGNFDNVRYGLAVHTTDVNGKWWHDFSPWFPNELLGVAGALDFSGGTRTWQLGWRDESRYGFSIFCTDAVLGHNVQSTGVGVYFIAVGR